MDQDELQLKQQMRERFLNLPQPVREAITSADIEKQLRSLAEKHRLHLDQWDLLENEVMLTVLGFERPENLEHNLINEVGISTQEASTLATDINTIVFEPIRAELEKTLERPAATPEEEGAPVAGAAGQSVAEEKPAVAPATPPAPKPETQVAKAPASGAYKPGEASSQRKSVHDDPYRELPQ